MRLAASFSISDDHIIVIMFNFRLNIFAMWEKKDGNFELLREEAAADEKENVESDNDEEEEEMSD